MSKEVRWYQRYENFSKAFDRLTSAVVAFETLSRLEKEGLIHRFEYTFELARKTLKDYLESQEVDVKFPRDVIKSAFHKIFVAQKPITFRWWEECHAPFYP